MQLGKGSIAYTGESPECDAGRRGLWRRFGRPVFIAVRTIAGLTFADASFTSAAIGTVTVFSPGELADRARVSVVLPDGATGQALVPYTETCAHGDQVTVSGWRPGGWCRGTTGSRRARCRYRLPPRRQSHGRVGIRQGRRRRNEGEL
jgi:hypothetical protein